MIQYTQCTHLDKYELGLKGCEYEPQCGLRSIKVCGSFEIEADCGMWLIVVCVLLWFVAQCGV